MIKVVFFDLYQTLIDYYPPRETELARIINDYGIKVTAETIHRPMVIADEFIYKEHALLPLAKRSESDQKHLYSQYQTLILKEAGIDPTPDLIANNIAKMRQVNFHPILFDDVLPTLKQLKNDGIILGLISNIDRDISSLFNKLGLTSLLLIVVTSLDCGYHKPQPEIFHEAARQAGVSVNESVYIGDQYQIDVLGAKEAGMQGVLIDRNGFFADVTEELIIRNLYQLVDYIHTERR
ncbi:MAG: HAD family hydrolase [Dehalococcoidia bacterium]|nr:MAG: HAD family hydrolase [Dehalococcoidia bacterium]